MSNPKTIRNGSSHDSQSKFRFVSKHLAQDSNTYVFQTAVNNLSNTSLAVALSNNKIQLYSDFNFNSSVTLQGHKKKITGLKFSGRSSTLLSSSLDGNIYVWDTRCKGIPVQTFSDETDGMIKPLSSFDFNIDEQIICAGTEIIREDSFLIFWDQRMSTNLGGYWNTHTDDITQVCFHPSQVSVMASGSVDGLINVYDLSNDCEDEALLETLNTGSSVNKLKWNNGDSSDPNADRLSCITHIEEYQLWSRNEASPLLSCERENISEKVQCNVDYLIDSFMLDNICLASGTNDGSIFLSKFKKGGPRLVASLKNEHKDVVRTLSWSKQNNLLVSGGEDGLVCLWESTFHEKIST